MLAAPKLLNNSPAFLADVTIAQANARPLGYFEKAFNLRSEWCDEKDQLEEAFDKGLVKLYDDCFKAAPYFEKYEKGDIEKIFYDYAEKGSSILLLYDQQNTVVGFSIKTPLINCAPAAQNAVGTFADVRSCFFGSDLGVKPFYRRQGISYALENTQVDRMASEGYVCEVTRTSASSYKRIASNLKSGKRRLPFVEQVTMPRLDGSTKSDQRIYFYRRFGITPTPIDATLGRVIIVSEDSVDVAYVFDAVSIKQTSDTVQRMKNNYPGIGIIKYASTGGDNVPSQKSALFDGSLPLVQMER